MPRTIRLLIIDDHPLFREGVASALRKADPRIEVSAVADAHAGLAAADTQQFDLVLIDLRLQAWTA